MSDKLNTKKVIPKTDGALDLIATFGFCLLLAFFILWLMKVAHIHHIQDETTRSLLGWFIYLIAFAGGCLFRNWISKGEIYKRVNENKLFNIIFWSGAIGALFVFPLLKVLSRLLGWL